MEEKVVMGTIDYLSDSNPVSLASSPVSEAVELVWRCLDCGYQRQSCDRPAGCPQCGASVDRVLGRTSVAWRLMLRAMPLDRVR